MTDLSLAVPQGEIFGFLGPNGAGKTTFIKVLLSLVHPTSGEVSILDTRLPNTRIRERIGYLPENHRFPGYLTGEQVLTFVGTRSHAHAATGSEQPFPLGRVYVSMTASP